MTTASRFIVTNLLIALSLAMIPGATANEPSHPDPIRQAMTTLESGSSLTELLDARLQIMKSPRDQGGSGLMSVQKLASDPDPTTLVFVEPFQAGDLDGDGKDDLIDFETRRNGDSYFYRMVGRRGLDAQVLWSRDLPESTLMLSRNFTGDQRKEIFLVSFSEYVEESGTPTGSSQTFHSEVSLQVVSSMNEVVWSRVVKGRFETKKLKVEGVASYYVESFDNLLVWAYPSADASGDGLEDLFLLTLDSDSESANLAGLQVKVQEYRTTGELVDVGNAETLGTVTKASEQGFQQVVSSADLTGDSLGDFAILEKTSGGFKVSAWPLKGDSPTWEVTRSTSDPYPYFYSAQLVDSVSGDLIIITHAEQPLRVIREAVRGTTGESLWQHSTNNYQEFTYVADSTHDGGTDVMLLDYKGGWRLELTMLRGSDLTVVWGPRSYFQELPPEYSSRSTNCACGWTGDLNADGIDDHIVANAGFNTEDQTSIVGAFGIDGRNGSVIWDLPPSTEYFWWPTRWDFNGNGTDDLIQVFSRYDVSADQTQVHWTTIEGSTAVNIWQTDAVILPGQAGSTALGVDLIDGPASEVVVSYGSGPQANPQFSTTAYRAAGAIWTYQSN